MLSRSLPVLGSRGWVKSRSQLSPRWGKRIPDPLFAGISILSACKSISQSRTEALFLKSPLLFSSRTPVWGYKSPHLGLYPQKYPRSTPKGRSRVATGSVPSPTIPRLSSASSTKTKPSGRFLNLRARSHAESKGFEPLVRGRRTTVFKTVSFGRSDNSPSSAAHAGCKRLV